MLLKDIYDDAQDLAEKTGIPHAVVWKPKHGLALIIMTEYSAAEHGCVEGIRYPEDYEYPYTDSVAVLDENLDLW